MTNEKLSRLNYLKKETERLQGMVDMLKKWGNDDLPISIKRYAYSETIRIPDEQKSAIITLLTDFYEKQLDKAATEFGET